MQQGGTIAPTRKKALNFIVLPSKAQRDADIEAQGGKWKSAYWADWRRAKKIERRSGGTTTVVYASTANEAFDQIKEKLGEDGYVANILIDYHRSPYDAASAGNDEFYQKLAGGYAGEGTSCYLGACWAGGNKKNPNLTENASKQLDGATVYGHKAQASGLSFFFSGHFSRYAGDKDGDYTNSEEFKNVGRHVVSYYNSQLRKVVSVEILDKVAIKNNGQVHSQYSKAQLMKLPVITPEGVFKLTPQPATGGMPAPTE